jgi:hypothetical protein
MQPAEIVVFRDHVIPIFYGRGYDGKLGGRAIKARSDRKNRSTLMWKNRPDLAKIVRRKFGQEYGGSEARNTWDGLLAGIYLRR